MTLQLHFDQPAITFFLFKCEGQILQKQKQLMLGFPLPLNQLYYHLPIDHKHCGVGIRYFASRALE